MISSLSETHLNYLNNLTDAFFRDSLNRNLAENTAKQYKASVQRYLELTGADQFRKDADYLAYKPHMTAFLEELRKKEISYSHMKAEFTALNNFFAFLIDDGIILNNPVLAFRARYVREFKDPTPDPRKVLTIEELALLLATAHTDRRGTLWMAVILLLAVTGLRRSELVALNIGDVDFENRILHVRKHKKRSNCLVPFSEEAAGFLLDYLEFRIELGHELNSTDPLFLGSFNKNRIGGEHIRLSLQRLGRKCGLHNDFGRSDEKLIIHGFRHTFTTLFKEAGMSPEFVAEARGDRRQLSQDAYYRITARRLREEYDKFAPRILSSFYSIINPEKSGIILSQKGQFDASLESCSA
jgi:Site-specific recombinase XerD